MYPNNSTYYFNNYNLILNFVIQFIQIKDCKSHDLQIILQIMVILYSIFCARCCIVWWHVCHSSFKLVQTLLQHVLQFYIIWCMHVLIILGTLHNFILQSWLICCDFTMFGVYSHRLKSFCFISVHLFACIWFVNLYGNTQFVIKYYLITCLKIFVAGCCVHDSWFTLKTWDADLHFSVSDKALPVEPHCHNNTGTNVIQTT